MKNRSGEVHEEALLGKLQALSCGFNFYSLCVHGMTTPYHTRIILHNTIQYIHQYTILLYINYVIYKINYYIPTYCLYKYKHNMNT